MEDKKKNMENFLEKCIMIKERCCGCSACYSICPVNAIEMVDDDEGFEYPYINTNICIKCNKCKRVCPIGGFL